jgi:hypothetical protein
LRYRSEEETIKKDSAALNVPEKAA